MKIICISGKARHGKDTCGNIFQGELLKRDYRVLVVHYGDLVKFICTNYFGWNGQKDEQGRGMLQRVGTDVIRNQDENFWVDEVARILKFFPDEWDYVLIPDARFPNEVSRLSEEYGFEVIHVRVHRPNFESDLTPEQMLHPSETALDNVTPDFLINNTTLENLVNQILSICDKI